MRAETPTTGCLRHCKGKAASKGFRLLCGRLLRRHAEEASFEALIRLLNTEASRRLRSGVHFRRVHLRRVHLCSESACPSSLTS